MVWIKRNLFFVISAAVGLVLTGYCGYLLYSALDANSGAGDEYANTLKQLEDMKGKNPFPSQENIQAAKEDQDKVRQFLTEFRKKFAPFPAPPVEDDQGFKNYLEDSIVRFRAEATNAGVQLPPDYTFSFSGLMGRFNYSSASISAWMHELQEISTILDILYGAKINYLGSLCRVPVSLDDTGNGDCLLQATTGTNQLGIVTPYKITFRGFSTEIAAVMEGFARSSNCFIIQSIDVVPDTSVQPIAVQPSPQQPAPSFVPVPRMQPTMGPGPRERGAGAPRYDRPSYAQAPVVPTTVASGASAPVMILSETPLLVTISLNVVKLKASEH
jgi:hypothetical protein